MELGAIFVVVAAATVDNLVESIAEAVDKTTEKRLSRDRIRSKWVLPQWVLQTLH